MHYINFLNTHYCVYNISKIHNSCHRCAEKYFVFFGARGKFLLLDTQLFMYLISFKGKFRYISVLYPIQFTRNLRFWKEPNSFAFLNDLFELIEVNLNAIFNLNDLQMFRVIKRQWMNVIVIIFFRFAR